MSVLCGLYHPDAGSIIWKGHPVRFASPRQAAAHGIGMVHQDFKLIQRMTVAENMMLGRQARRARTSISARPCGPWNVCRQISGLPVDARAPVRQLSAGMQQRVAILKVLAGNPDLVIFDEPTSVLTPQEAESLFKMMQSLVAGGKSICFITHKLDEVMSIATRVTVLRDGRVIDTLETRQTNPRELARKMVGREVIFTVQKPACEPGDVVLDVRQMATAGRAGTDRSARHIAGGAAGRNPGCRRYQRQRAERAGRSDRRPAPGSVGKHPDRRPGHHALARGQDH